MRGRTRDMDAGLVYYVFTGLVLLQLLLSSETRGDEGQVGNCTLRFPSSERMQAVINKPHSYYQNTQGIIPSMKFTCNGSIRTWIFAADFKRPSSINDAFTELQIWRPLGGYYIKVGNSTVKTGKNISKIYYYHLSTPLKYRAGDIVGYYQSHYSHRLLFERVGPTGQRVYFRNNQGSASNQFAVAGSRNNTNIHALLGVIADCTCGFMSIGRIKLLLEADSIQINSRQQVTPDMLFTCSGFLIKWIIGARWNTSGTLFPELQIWNKTGSNTYKMVHQITIKEITTKSYTNIYNYNDFPPIPIEPGYILGIYLPEKSQSRLSIISEKNSALNYFVSANIEPSSQNIDVRELSSDNNRPLVSAEIVSALPVSKTIKHKEIEPTRELCFPVPGSMAPSIYIKPTVTGDGVGPHQRQGLSGWEWFGVGLGLTAATVALLVATVLGACLYQRKYKTKSKEPVVSYSNVQEDNGTMMSGNTTSVTGYNSNNEESSTLVAEYQSLTPPTFLDFQTCSRSSSRVFTAGDDDGHYEMDEATLSTVVDYCVPSRIQRQPPDYNNDGSCPHSVLVKDFFLEHESFWTPATSLGMIYDQMSCHKFREMNRQYIEMGGSLGSGEFGVVSRGRWLNVIRGPMEVAIKTLRPAANVDIQVKFLQEAAIIGQFKHPNIVKLHGVVTVEEPMMVVMEFMANGDLRNYLISLITHPDPPEQGELSNMCLNFCRHIASGMSYLADKTFVHRDLAARNILVSVDNICKVADFGMSKVLDSSDYYVSHGGMIPVKWTAPEAIYEKKYTTASDVWSFGCVMYEIWSVGHKPFEGFTNSEAMEMVAKGNRLSPPPGCPRRLYSLMISCWNPERLDRPLFSSLCQTLAEEADSLLQWKEEDSQCHPQASLLGVPLEAGALLYHDLQTTYHDTSRF